MMAPKKSFSRRRVHFRLMCICILTGSALPFLYLILDGRHTEVRNKDREYPIRFHSDRKRKAETVEHTLSSVEERMQSRLNIMQQHCSNVNSFLKTHFLTTKSLFSKSPIISRAHNFLYCPAGKIASTFLTRLVIAMERSNPVMSPFDLPIQNSSREKCESFKSFQSESDRFAFLNRAVKMVFVREPYYRVFSAYVDKMLSPNPDYWGMWGKKALRLSGTPVRKIGCGHNATFAQFVRLVVTTLHRSDIHVRPVSKECSPCHVGYDIIGHLETLRDDVILLTSTLNLSADIIRQVDFSAAVAEDAIRDSTDSPFGWKNEILKCISSDEMGLRIWRKMQLRGIISYRINYPFRGQDIREVTASEFKDTLRQARAWSLAYSEELSQQKKKAYLEAYRTVPLKDLKALGNIYKSDLAAFGYEREPKALFERSDAANFTDVFDCHIDNWYL